MRGELVLGLALLSLLTWAGEADKQAQLKRITLRRRTRLGRLQPFGTGRDRTVAGVSPLKTPTASRIRRGETMQADQSSGPPASVAAGQSRRRGRMSLAEAGRRGSGLGQAGNPPQPGMLQDEGTPGARARVARMPSNAGSPNLLASFAGKNRVLVISAPHESDGYYRLMMSLLKPDVYCELAERHVQQIVMFHEEGEMGGKVRRITQEGKVMEEPLDTALIPRLMSFLKLEKGKFGMVLLRKTLQVEERYPYPVRLEAVYEVIDQAPMRKLEKLRQKGFVQKCKGAGVEGQVEEGTATGGQVDMPVVGRPDRKQVMPRPTTTATTTTKTTTTTTRATTTTTKPTTTTTRPTTTTTTRPTTTTTKPTTTTTKPTTTTTKPTTTTTRPTTTTTRPTTTTTRPTTTTTRPTTTTIRRTTTTTTKRPTTTKQTTTITTPKPSKAQTEEHWLPASRTTPDPYLRRGRERHPPKTTPAGDNRTDKNGKEAHSRKQDGLVPTAHKPSKTKPSKKKNGGKYLTNEYEDKYEVGEPTASHPEEPEVTVEVAPEVTPTKRVKVKHEKNDKKKKKSDRQDKASKREKAERRGGKPGKEGKSNGKKNGKKLSKHSEKEEYQKPTKKPAPPKGTLATFLDYFEGKRRLLVITAPGEENSMYVQQRDEYLENVCEMAIRKVSIVTIFGSLTNSTMKIDHYQLENDKTMKGLRQEDLVNQDLITELRKDFGMTFNDFYMVLTDTDMRVKQFYEVPIAMKAVFDFVDTFSSRIREMEEQKKKGVECKKEDKPRSLENFLSRFRWRRRLFLISAPNDEEWAYQQQLYALTSQACNLGLRHISILKLVGMDAADMGGVLELYPINGSATVDREGLSATLVKDIRNYFQISPEYFSMLLVGKDGNVKSWYPSPMWSMAIIYDLVDSMQLRRQEMAIQQSLGMRCPEDEYGGYGYHHHGYDGYQDAYHQGYGY